MRILLKILVLSLAVFFASYILKGVYLDGFPTAILVAVVLSVLNALVRPVFVLLTIPFTLITFGLFLLVINAVMILLTDFVLDGFHVDGFMTALLFSIIISVSTWILEAIANPKKNNS